MVADFNSTDLSSMRRDRWMVDLVQLHTWLLLGNGKGRLGVTDSLVSEA